MTISKNSFHRFSIATQIFGTLVAGSVLLAGIDAANAHGSGGGGGGGNHGGGGGSWGGNHSNSSGMSNSHSNSGNSWSGKSSGNSMSGQKKPVFVNTIHPIISKGSGSSHKESKRELRKEYRKELRKEIAQLKKTERCKVFGKCGSGGPKPIGTQPVKIGKPIPAPVEKPPVTTTGGGTKPPVLSDPGYGKPSGGTQTGGTQTSSTGGGGPASPGKIGDPPSGGTTIKQF